MDIITGSAGYIGRHLSNKLPSFNRMDKKHTLSTDITLPLQYQQVDTLIHLAALVRVNESIDRPLDYYNTNVYGTINILKTMDINNFIFASTGCAETSDSPYAKSKKMAEDVIIDTCEKHGINYTIFRFYNVVGATVCLPTNPDGLLSNLIKAKYEGPFKLYGTDYPTRDGTCIRDYIHVDDVCDSIIKAIDKPSNKIENLGSGVGHTVLQIVDMFERVNNVKINVEYHNRRSGDVAVSVLDNVSPYFTPKRTIEDMLRV
jgi:UDP-glucose 4-epimerase